QPLYDRTDAHRTAGQFFGIPYDRPFDLKDGLSLRFVDAGHLLGSAMVSVHVEVGGRSHSITFTGDLGRRGLPILRDPSAVPPGELLISESTYGGQQHPPADLLAGGLGDLVQKTVDRGG